MRAAATAALLAATLTTGLTAGLYAAFGYAVLPGLARAGDAVFVEAVQRVNVAILNGWFAVCFGGALVSGLAAAALHLAADRRPVLPWIAAGVLLYVATLVVTLAVNVPLNDRLAAAGDPGSVPDPAAARAAFEAAWVRWNAVRAVLAVAATGTLAWALVQHGRLPG